MSHAVRRPPLPSPPLPATGLTSDLSAVFPISLFDPSLPLASTLLLSSHPSFHFVKSCFSSSLWSLALWHWLHVVILWISSALCSTSPSAAFFSSSESLQHKENDLISRDSNSLTSVSLLGDVCADAPWFSTRTNKWACFVCNRHTHTTVLPSIFSPDLTD